MIKTEEQQRALDEIRKIASHILLVEGVTDWVFDTENYGLKEPIIHIHIRLKD